MIHYRKSANQAGSNKNRPGTGIEGHGKREVSTALFTNLRPSPHHHVYDTKYEIRRPVAVERS